MSLSIELKSLSKSFGLVHVLHDISMNIHSGRVTGLLGENGAGKSTLVKVLAGYESPSAGEMFINGVAQEFRNARDAEACGVVMIHQEFLLAEDLTIAQNIFLGREQCKGALLDDQEMDKQTKEALQKVGLDIDPRTKIKHLIVAEKQLVEIAKALSRNARLLIMDEPTATLTPGETRRLFELIAQLKAKGVTIIYISHKLDEVEQVTDELIFMRDGRYVTQARTRDLSRKEMANLMVGRELSDMFPPKEACTSEAPLLSVRNATVPRWAKDVSFDVRPGEILGFAGLVGAGRTELFEGMLGLRPRNGGEIAVDGVAVKIASPSQALKAGIAYLSEDRKGKGVHVKFGLKENLTLAALERYAHPFLDKRAEKEALKVGVQGFGIRARSYNVKASSLSGGNQQKLALAKFLHSDPRIIVLDEPTRGVDVGAKRDIYFLIQKLAREGRAVIVISSELVELIGLCHRVIVMRNGRIQATVEEEHLTEEELIGYATGTH